MKRFILRSGATLFVVALVLLACGGAAPSKRSGSAASGDLGVDVAGLSSIIDNPYVPFARLKRAVYEGWELDEKGEDTVRVRSVVTVRDSVERVAGISATVVEVLDFENGEMVERSRDYYAQDTAGAVHYIAARVDDFENGKVVGHDGQWFAGEKRARAGLLMPAMPAVGDARERMSVTYDVSFTTSPIVAPCCASSFLIFSYAKRHCARKSPW